MDLIDKIETGRNNSFKKVLQILFEEYDRPITIVESGCIRTNSDTGKFGDGWSTYNWEYFAKKTNSNVYVVDINESHIITSKEIVPESIYVTHKLQDSVEYLKTFEHDIDLLFLDSYDYCGDEENIKKCHNHSLNELKAAWNKLKPKCYVLFDDVFNSEWDGKGKLSIPYLLENGFEIVYHIDCQVLLKRN